MTDWIGVDMYKPIEAGKPFIEDRIRVNDQTGCWEWQLSKNPQTGYGQIGVKPYTAHRLAFILWHGDPGNLHVRHMCHNRACCNPEHLQSGTPLDNYHDSAETHRAATAARRGRKSHNAKPVTINGIEYPSIDHATKALRLSYYTVVRLGNVA